MVKNSFVIPKCSPDHSGDSGPYCVQCSGEEQSAFQLIVEMRKSALKDEVYDLLMASEVGKNWEELEYWEGGLV